MSETKVLLAAITAVALSASIEVSSAQYNGPPIIIQTPQLTPPSRTDTLKPLTGTTLPAAPAAAAPARPCAANTKC